MKFGGETSPPGYLLNGSTTSVAPASTCRLRLLAKVSGPLRKVPAGISTVPMPPALAELMAFWIAVVLVVTPSPTAPKAVTLLVPGGMVGRVGGRANAEKGENTRMMARSRKVET